MKYLLDSGLILDMELTPEIEVLAQRWYQNYHRGKRNKKVIYNEWRLFSNYYNWVKTFNNWKDLTLLVISDDNIYSPSTCLLCSVNLIRSIKFTNNKTNKMMGAHYDITKDKFRAVLKIDNKSKYYPRVNSELEAHHMWLADKIEHLSSFYSKEDSRVVKLIKEIQSEMRECLNSGIEWKPKKYLLK